MDVRRAKPSGWEEPGAVWGFLAGGTGLFSPWGLLLISARARVRVARNVPSDSAPWGGPENRRRCTLRAFCQYPGHTASRTFCYLTFPQNPERHAFVAPSLIVMFPGRSSKLFPTAYPLLSSPVNICVFIRGFNKTRSVNFPFFEPLCKKRIGEMQESRRKIIYVKKKIYIKKIITIS